MNNKEKLEDWKRIHLKLEKRIEILNNYRNKLLNTLNEIKANRNARLSFLLKDSDLEGEISYLKDKIEFYREKISRIENRILALEKEISAEETEKTKEEILRQELTDLDEEFKKASEREKESQEKQPEQKEAEVFEIEIEQEREAELDAEKKAEKEQSLEEDILKRELDGLSGEFEERLRKEKSGQKKASEREKEEQKKPQELFEIEISRGLEEEKEGKKAETKPKTKQETKKPFETRGLLPGKEERPQIEFKGKTEESIKEYQKKASKKTRFKERFAAIREHVKNIFKKPKLNKNKLISYGALIVLLVLVTSVLFVSKPEITGYAVLSEKKTYDDNLNLVVNESGNYTWTADNAGDIESIKASGRVKGNGTVKVYIEKDGKRYLIYGNK